jgi:hypothetical protein
MDDERKKFDVETQKGYIASVADKNDSNEAAGRQIFSNMLITMNGVGLTASQMEHPKTLIKEHQEKVLEAKIQSMTWPVWIRLTRKSDI